MENQSTYHAPAINVVELAIENAILRASGEDSIPGLGLE